MALLSRRQEGDKYLNETCGEGNGMKWMEPTARDMNGWKKKNELVLLIIVISC
jgi:hypothetical protein